MTGQYKNSIHHKDQALSITKEGSMKKCHMFIAVLVASIFTACCHTNNLKEYPISDRSFYFMTEVDPGATKVELNIDSPAPGRSAVIDVLADVGSGVLSSEASEKLNRAINPLGIAAAVSSGFEKVLTTHYKARAVIGRSDNPAFLVNTRLKECSLHSGSGGIELCIKSQAEITDAATGKTVWRDCEDNYVPVKRTPVGTVPIPVLGTAMSVYNASEFFKLSDHDIQDIILDAAENVGTNFGKSLRHDNRK
jgi:hypothetical protein